MEIVDAIELRQDVETNRYYMFNTDTGKHIKPMGVDFFY